MERNIDGRFITVPIGNRFWEKVDKTDGCWLWLGAKSCNGYGLVWRDGHSNHRAHRIAWELVYGSIPATMCVCHHCDNKLCVRPDHLFLGTRLDNNHDMIQKGRDKLVRFGKREAHFKVRLTEEQATEIRLRFAAGRYGIGMQLAREYSVSPGAIYAIAHNRAWKEGSTDVH